MPNSTSPKLLPLLAVGFLAASACSLSPPPAYTGSTAGTVGTCTGSGGGGGGGDGGGSAPYVVVTPISCSASNATLRLPYTDGYTPNGDDQKAVNNLIATMSLYDKAQQMRGTNYGASGVTQMGDTQRSQDTATIRGFHYRDASRGMNLAEDMSGIRPNAGFQPGSTTPVGYSTVFPVSMSRGAAFDLDLEFAIGEAIGDEMMAANETLLLAPCMNILRHPLWGRAQETYGEDAFHIGRLSSAMTVGVQQHIAANAKHFMAYDIEANRDFNDMLLDQQTMRETYGRHFRMVVQDGGVASVMASYNQVNDQKSTVNHTTLTDILRTDFGFQGFVLSDWWAMDPQTDTSRPPTFYEANAIKGVAAGLDVELPWSLNYCMLESIVQTNGGLKQADIDAAATRVLMQKFRFDSWDLSKGHLRARLTEDQLCQQQNRLQRLRRPRRLVEESRGGEHGSAQERQKHVAHEPLVRQGGGFGRHRAVQEQEQRHRSHEHLRQFRQPRFVLVIWDRAVHLPIRPRWLAPSTASRRRRRPTSAL